jgi:hypothetical protein
MARVLTETDIKILKKCAPEFAEQACSTSGEGFRSVLPPVAIHYARSGEDFIRRCGTLSDEELAYLAGLIIRGEESVCCIPPDYMVAFVDLLAERLDRKTAEAVYFTWEAGFA